VSRSDEGSVPPYRVEAKTYEPWPPRYYGRHTHPLRQAWKRFGVRLMPLDLEDIERRIGAGETDFLGWDRNGRQVWEVELGGKVARAIYNPESKQVATFYTETMSVAGMTLDARAVNGRTKSNLRLDKKNREWRRWSQTSRRNRDGTL